MENYVITDLIGEGSFGKVYKGRRKYTGKAVALKFIVKLGKQEKDLQALLSEVEILQKLKHPNIIQMLDVFETRNEICVVTELAQGELFHILEDDKSLPEAVVRDVACQMVKALDYLHSHRIIHRDIKPQNVLFCSNGRVALCDFGFARLMSQHTTMLTSIKGTPLYMAPELVKEQPYNQTADLWSLGVILYELRVGKPPFFTNNIYKLIRMIINENIKWPQAIPPQMRSFLELLLVKDPTKRGSWKQVRSHPWIQEPSQSCRAADRPSENNNVGPRVATAPPSSYWETQEAKSRDPHNAMALRESKEFNMNLLTLLSEAFPSGLAARVAQGEGLPPVDPQKVVGALRTMGNVFKTSADAAKAEGQKHSKSVNDAEREVRQSGEWIQAICRLAGRCVNVKKETRSEGGDANEDSEAATLLLSEGLKACTTMASSVFSTHGNIGVPESYSKQFMPLAPKILALDDGDRLADRGHDSTTAAVRVNALEYTNVLLKQAAVTPEQSLSFYSDAINERLQVSLGKLIIAKGGCNKATSTAALETLSSLVHPTGGLVHSFPLSDDEGGSKSSQELTPVPNLGMASENDDGKEVKAGGRLDSEVRRSVAGALVADRRILQGIIGRLIETGHVGVEGEGGKDDIKQAQAALRVLLQCARSNQQVASGVSQSLPAMDHLRKLVKADQCDNGVRALAMLLMGALYDAQAEMKAATNDEKSRHYSDLSSAADAEDAAVDSVLKAVDSMLNADSPAVKVAASDLCARLVSSGSNTSRAVVRKVESSLPQISAALLEGMDARREGGEIGVEGRRQAFTMEQLEGSSFGALSNGTLDGLMGVVNAVAKSRDGRVAQDIVKTGVFARVCDHVIRREAGSLSFKGLDAALETLSIVAAAKATEAARAKSGAGGKPERVFSDELIQSLIGLCREGQLKGLKAWPEDLGGGKESVARVLSRVVAILGVPFQEGGGASMALEQAKVMKAAYNQLFVRHLLVALRTLPPTPSAVLPPLSFLCRLVLEDRRGFFARQFAEHRGPAALVALGLLSHRAAPEVIVETLVILSHLARVAGDPALAKRLPRKGYLEESLHASDIYVPLRELLVHRSAPVRAKSCNLVGNLCRNSAFFYPHLQSHHLLSPLIQCCVDSDPSVRTFAVVATGNAAFHSSDLYQDLKPAVVILEERVNDMVSGKMRANAAGALGNLVRNGDELVDALVQAGVVGSLLKVALNDENLEARRISLFSLGNIMKFESGRKAALKPPLRLMTLLDSMAKSAEETESKEITLE
eukprot:CAMPEP_0197536986 /NCGR_PEP_ID=MMETSP1318-20131121/55494_1 /TAXON_ID=552666 /ORGANISM="Partenskyella glossopodia, Strain RCC365" /LENGTH=1269 /DNA_ID=CAMNT_0043095029 /DNA_START=175 /DNA_END=3985 /DNA_ORIENTATION=-